MHQTSGSTRYWADTAHPPVITENCGIICNTHCLHAAGVAGRTVPVLQTKQELNLGAAARALWGYQKLLPNPLKGRYIRGPRSFAGRFASARVEQ